MDESNNINMYIATNIIKMHFFFLLFDALEYVLHTTSFIKSMPSSFFIGSNMSVLCGIWYIHRICPLLLWIGRIFPASNWRSLAPELVLVAVASSFVKNAVCTEFMFTHHAYSPSGRLSASDSSSTVSFLNVPRPVSKPMVYIYTTRLS